jgi:hypothetical protein
MANGQWAREATRLEYRNEERRLEIPAPDGRKKAVVEGASLKIVADRINLPGVENVGISSLAELLWAPDSRALFVTQSYGGAVGEWRVTVYLVRQAHAEAVNVSQAAVTSFKRHYRCKDAEEPNVAAVAWTEGSRYLLLVTEVPPHSSCPEMGKIRGYLVDASSGRVVRTIEPRELTARWSGALGERLRQR